MHSETTPEGRKETHLAEVLLDGSNVCMVRMAYAL